MNCCNIKDADVGRYVPANEKAGIAEVIERDYFRQGWIFKSKKAYEASLNAVCYIPELSDKTYTKNDFLRIACDDEKIAERMFDDVDWQHPETWLDDQLANEEFAFCQKCGKLFESCDSMKCPNCGFEE